MKMTVGSGTQSKQNTEDKFVTYQEGGGKYQKSIAVMEDVREGLRDRI